MSTISAASSSIFDLGVEVRALIADYLNDDISVVDFQKSFVHHLIKARPRDDKETKGIVFGTELRLAEFTSGHRTEDYFRSSLEQLLNAPYLIETGMISSSANNTTMNVSPPSILQPLIPS